MFVGLSLSGSVCGNARVRGSSGCEFRRVLGVGVRVVVYTCVCACVRRACVRACLDRGGGSGCGCGVLEAWLGAQASALVMISNKLCMVYAHMGVSIG